MMQFDFDSARVTPDGELCLKVKNPPAARQFVLSMKQRTYTCEVKEQHKKRSLDANAMYWKLANDLSEAIRIPPAEIYRQHIRDIGGNYWIVPIREDALETWDRIWTAGHIGRQIEDMGECRNTKGYHNVRCYWSSSDYDTRQMSRLIDLVVQDCQAVGVETANEQELSLLLEKWGDAK